MDIIRLDPINAADVRAAVSVLNAARAVDAPLTKPTTEINYGGWLRVGWDGDAPYAWLARAVDAAHGEVVGVLQIEASTYDNPHLAWLDITVHPRYRRRGYGSALYEHGLAYARGDLGRTTIGLEGWDAPVSRSFAAARGYEPRYIEALRRQTLAEVDWDTIAALRADAEKAAVDYELVRLRGRTPDHMLDAMVDLVAAINDAPRGGFDWHDEIYSADRVRAYENACEIRGQRVYRVVARHRGTGELAGHTVVAIDSARPTIGDQHDTSVIAKHRGHRLGVLLKAEMMTWLAQAEPQLATIDTGNEENNTFMVSVNEKLGYRLIARGVLFQRSYPAADV